MLKHILIQSESDAAGLSAVARLVFYSRFAYLQFVSPNYFLVFDVWIEVSFATVYLGMVTADSDRAVASEMDREWNKVEHDIARLHLRVP